MVFWQFGLFERLADLTCFLRFSLTLFRWRLATDNQKLLTVRRRSRSYVGAQRILTRQKLRRFHCVGSGCVKLHSVAALLRLLTEKNVLGIVAPRDIWSDFAFDSCDESVL